MAKRLLKSLLLIVALTMVATSVPASVSAQDGPGDKVVFKKRTLVDFSDVSIQGELRKPEGDFYGSKKRTRFQKLIRVRQDFVNELKWSTDNL